MDDRQRVPAYGCCTAGCRSQITCRRKGKWSRHGIAAVFVAIKYASRAYTLPSDLVPSSIQLQLQLCHGPVDGVPRAALFTQLPVRVIEHLSHDVDVGTKLHRMHAAWVHQPMRKEATKDQSRACNVVLYCSRRRSFCR